MTNRRDTIAELLAEHQRWVDNGACRCGEWSTAERVMTWMDHVADVIDRALAQDENRKHGPDWDNDERPSCRCGFNGTPEECLASRAAPAEPRQDEGGDREALTAAVKRVYDRHDHTRPLNHVNVVEWVDAVFAEGFRRHPAPAPDREALADFGRQLAPLLRAGLWGANVPIGMDLPVTQHTTDDSIVAAQDEFARRALTWALTHPDAAQIVEGFRRHPEVEGDDLAALVGALADTDAITATDGETLYPPAYVVHAENLPYLVKTVLDLAQTEVSDD